MTISSGSLDSLLNASFAVDTLANLTYLSGTAANGAPTSVTARTGSTTYPGLWVTGARHYLRYARLGSDENCPASATE